jgi:PAS domain S-box-containing protein
MDVDLMKTIVNSSHAVVFLWESLHGWKVSFVSDNVSQFGYTPEELIEGNILYPELIHPEDRVKAIEEVKNYKKNHVDKYTQEYRLVTKTGDIRWVTDQTSVCRDKKNKILYHHGIVVDITERKKIETEAQHLKNIIDNSPVIAFIWSVSPNWKVLYVSRNIQNFGYSSEEILEGSKNYIDFIHPEDKERIMREVSEYAKGNQDEYAQEYRIITKTGEVRWVDDRTKVERDKNNKPIYHQGVVVDVTDRKKMEKRFKNTNDQLNTIIQSSPLALYDFTLDGKVKSIWNPAAERMFGWKREDVLGKYLPIVPINKQKEYDKNRKRVLHENIVNNIEVVRMKKDGTQFPIRISLCTQYNEKEEPCGILAMTSDLTDQKKTDELKNEFISIITHELKAPLTSIRDSVNLIELANPDKENLEYKIIIEKSQKNINHLTRLIADILDYQKLEKGSVVYHFKPHMISDLIEEKVEQISQEIKEKGLTLELNFSEKVPEFPFDWDRIDDVLDQLLSNAVKFTNKGKILIKTDLLEEKNQVQITITDTGMGIEKEMIPKLFDKHYQLSRSSKHNTGGSGLGLAIIKKIVESHKGVLSVESELGKGSSFSFFLPLREYYSVTVKPTFQIV